MNYRTIVIEPSTGWRRVDLRELLAYRDLFLFLVWRNIRIKYAQSILGTGWAVIQPLFMMGVFTIVFGRLAGIASDGVPYAAFSLAALVPWTFFSNALLDSTNSLVGNSNLLTKVYFPRAILPCAAVTAKLVDFGVGLVLLGGVVAWFGIAPSAGLLALPVLVVVMLLAAAGSGMWLTALAIQYRDVQYAAAFFVQLLMYAAPVVYPFSLVPERYATVYALNPMVSVIEGFRAAILGTRPMPWSLIGIGAVGAVFIFVSGALFFHQRESSFADVA